MAEPIFPYPAPRVSNRSGTINVQFGSYTLNFGRLGSSVGNQQYTGRAFCPVYFNLPAGIYNFDIKQIQVSQPQGYLSQETFVTKTTLPSPSYLIEGSIFTNPTQLDDNSLASGIKINSTPSGTVYHSGIAMKELTTTVINPEWKCQYVNLTASQYVPMNLRICNRDPLQNLSVPEERINYFRDEPIAISGSNNTTWPWRCQDDAYNIVAYNAASQDNLFNVIMTIEYNRINALPPNGA